MKIGKSLFLIILVVLLVGLVHASDIYDDTSTQSLQKDTSTTNTIEHNMIKEVKDKKTATNDKNDTKTTVSATKSIIGENLELNAKVTDTNNKKVNEGYVLFKLNGITIKDNRKLTGSSNPLKVNVNNGTATTIVTADLSMRYAQNLTAVYSGSSTYEASRSNTAKAQIQQRNASIIVTSNVKTIKQGQKLILKAQIYDTTNNQKSTKLIPFDDEYVYFKVNGLTLKNTTGEVLKTKVINGVATTNYTIPLGLSGVTDAQTLTPKNHTILAGFYNKNYQENIRNTSTFQVERSPITINIDKVTIDNKNHKLSLNATIKDYLGNKVSGPNKCIVKINGVSLKNGTQAMYYYSTNGLLTIKNTPIPLQDKYTTLEIVTQDRLAYKSQRNTTTKFNIIKQNTIIKLNNVTKTDYNNNMTLTGQIIGKNNEILNNKTLTITFNGQTTKINTENKGNFKFTNKTNLVGTNSITVKFDGDSNYLSTNNKTTFQVIHKPTIIDFTVKDVDYNDYTEIEGILEDVEYNPLIKTRIMLNINGEAYFTRTDENGQFNYLYQTKKSGKNSITAIFNGTEYYNYVSKTKTFNVNKLESRIFLDYLSEAVSLGDIVSITGAVTDNAKDPIRNANVTIKINNNRYNVKTNNYGEYSYNYKTTQVGTNQVEVTANGNENYQTSTASDYFTVLQTHTITLYPTINSNDERLIGRDMFTSWIQDVYGEYNEGVYVLVYDYYADELEDPADNLLINATFYFKNSKGNVISRTFTDGNGIWLSHELIPGYTLFKTVATYRRMTDYESSLWGYGYEYNPLSKEWIQVYDPNTGDYYY